MSNTLPSELDSIQPSFGLPAFPKKEQPVFTDSAVPFQSDFLAASQRYGVPLNVIMGIADQESGFNPKALGIPNRIITAEPIGGLASSQTDEECFGFTYDDLESYIKGSDDKHSDKIKTMISQSEYKRKRFNIEYVFSIPRLIKKV